MKLLSKARIKKLEHRGIRYERPRVVTWTSGKKPVVRYIDDEADKEEIDIHLDRLSPITAADYQCGKESDWEVTENGDLFRESNGYGICAEQLIEQNDWLLHLMEKDWMNYNSFIPAYFKALEKLGKKEVTIKIAY